MKKRLIHISMLLIGIAILVIIIVTLVIPYFTERPPRAVWVSDNPYIVIFQHRRYSSPFDHSDREGFRPGYLVDDSGEKTYFFVSFAGGRMSFYDLHAFFSFNDDMWYEPIMHGYWRRRGRQVILSLDDKDVSLSRTTDYEHPNTFAWNPGLENLHGIWETNDGRLWLDLEEAALVRTENDGFISGIISSIFTSPRFQGVYDSSGVDIGLLIRGDFTPHTGEFTITISENGNLRGHSFAPIGGGRFMRADGTLENDILRLQLDGSRFTTISGDWHFPNEIILYRISD